MGKSEVAAKSSSLEGDEEVVEFGEVGAQAGFLLSNSICQVRETLLQSDWGLYQAHGIEFRFRDIGHRSSSSSGQTLDYDPLVRLNHQLPEEFGQYVCFAS